MYWKVVLDRIKASGGVTDGPCGLAEGSVDWPEALWINRRLCGLAGGSVVWPEALWISRRLYGLTGSSVD